MALTGAAGAVSAAAVEEEAAMAAAAIASGALGLLATGGVVGVLAGATVTGMTTAIAFGIATGVTTCCGVAVGSVEPAEFLSADGLSVDLPSLDCVEPDLASVDCVALEVLLEPAVALLELSDRPALLLILFEFEGGGAWLAGAASDDGWLAEACDGSLAARCGADGSGAGGRELVLSACVLLSTRAAKLSFACEGSGGANFGGALE